MRFRLIVMVQGIIFTTTIVNAVTHTAFFLSLSGSLPNSEFNNGEVNKVTNFENWKATATPDDILKMSASIDNFGFSRGKQHKFTAFYCPDCPARSFCESDKSDDKCHKIFRKWAETQPNN
jgi:hypothetical protein